MAVALYLFSTIAVMNFVWSFLADLSDRARSPEMLPKDDFSRLVILPIVFIFAIIWGWIFDWRKNKAIKSQTGNE